MLFITGTTNKEGTTMPRGTALYENELMAQLTETDRRVAVAETVARNAARFVADDFDGTEVLPSYAEAIA